MFKGAWRTRVRAAELESAIDATIAWFQERDAPFFFWWTGPQTRAEGFGEALEARGLMSMAEQTREMATGIRSTELGSPGMIADLTEVPLEVLAQVPDGFAISRVTTREDLEDFKRVLVGAYGMPEAMADGWVQAAETVGIGRTPWRMYLGRLNGVPVATNMVLAGAGVTSVYGVATIPEARGQGIGGAITLAPLLEDRDAGIRFAVLFSSMQGVGAYRRIGFREVDGIWIDRYLWRRP
jgi:fermentation-respiration switch protein FrsA (DUF1100 family)